MIYVQLYPSMHRSISIYVSIYVSINVHQCIDLCVDLCIDHYIRIPNAEVQIHVFIIIDLSTMYLFMHLCVYLRCL
jgi:hypothetical protein